MKNRHDLEFAYYMFLVFIFSISTAVLFTMTGYTGPTAVESALLVVFMMGNLFMIGLSIFYMLDSWKKHNIH